MGFSAFRGRWDYRVSRPPAPLRNAAAQRRRMAPTAALRMPGVNPERAGKIRMGAMFEGADSLGDTPQHLVELVRSGTGVSIGNL